MGGKRTGRDRGRRDGAGRGLLRALRDMAPIPLIIFGLLVALSTALSLPADVGALQTDTRLRHEGTMTTGVVTAVEVTHHSGRRSSYDEYTPTVRFSWRGERSTVMLGRYAVVDDAHAYREGQDVTVMVLPSSGGGTDLGIRTEAARSRLVGDVRNDVVLAAIGLAALGAGIAIPLIKRLRRRGKGRGKGRARA